MMKKLCLLIFLLCFYVESSFAQELFIRNDKYYTELYLKVDTSQIRSVSKNKDSVDVYFLKNLKAPFSKTFEDKFLSSVSAKNNVFSVFLKPDSEFTVVNDEKGIKIVATNKKTNSDILSSYGINNPLLSVDSNEDANQEEALNRADAYITNKQFAEGARELNNIIQKSNNDFYRQEAFYKLGQTYLLMAQYDENYLVDAYNTFDDFIRLYPNNFRAADAMMKSAEAKEKANQLFEAAFTYEKIYETVPDIETKRYALNKIAEIYVTVGQLEKAIDVYKEYLKKFRTGKDEIYTNIGMIFYDLREFDLAYEYFSLLDLDKVINDPKNDVDRLFAIAKNMELKKQYDKALKLYNVIYEKYPDSEKSNDAILLSASILEKTGRVNEADELLLKLKEMFPDRISGQQATVSYAQKYLTTKPYAYWQEFFKDLLSRPDDFGLHEQAKYMLLDAMGRENNIDGIINGVPPYLAEYPNSPHKDKLNKLREEFMYHKAASTFTDGNFQNAEQQLNTFLQEFPETAHVGTSASMLLDIKFDKVKKKYDDGNYSAVIRESEAHIAENPNSKELARWFILLDDSRYRDLSIIYSSQDWPASRVAARQYLSSFPKGRHVETAVEILEKSFITPLEATYKKGDFKDVIRLYDANKDWIEKQQNKNFKDRVATLTALSVYKLGSPIKARQLYETITPNNSIDYSILGLVLGDKTKTFDVNAFDEPTLRYVIGEVEQLDSNSAISMLKQYTKNPKLATSIEYAIAKNTPQDAKRQEILMDVYNTISNNPAAAFDGSNDVNLDIGLIYYRKNDFKNAVIPLKTFLDNYKEKDDKRAEALYYMGKSFIGLNDAQRGFLYYNEIIETIPSSIYAGIAKSELDEDMWKQNLNRF